MFTIPIPEEVREAVVRAESRRKEGPVALLMPPPKKVTAERKIEPKPPAAPKEEASGGISLQDIVLEALRDVAKTEVKRPAISKAVRGKMIRRAIERKRMHHIGREVDRKAQQEEDRKKMALKPKTLLEMAEKALYKIERDYKDEERKKIKINQVFGGSLNNTSTFIAKITESGEQQYVNSYDRFLELLRDVPAENIQEQQEYCGFDWNEVTLFTVKLPKNYIARVNAVYLKDVGFSYFDTGRVKLRLKKDGRTQGSFCQAYCYAMPCVVASSNLFSDYHTVSVRVLKKDLTVLGWVPGLHLYHRPDNGLCAIGGM